MLYMPRKEAMNISLIHEYEDSNNMFKIAKKDGLQQSETALTT